MPLLLALALVRLVVHVMTNGQYGFHRDELQVLDDARHLGWGYVVYPPLTPFLARVAMDIFGPSPAGVRFLAALAQSLSILFTGLIAKELGGDRSAQAMAALAVFASPVSLSAGHLFQYVSFDFLWSVLTIYFVAKLLKSNDGRWWMGVGAAVGLGLLTRYTILWLAAGIIGGFLFTAARSHLRSEWFAVGVVLAALIALPNLVWQIRHGFVSLEFLQAIHARDIAWGRTNGFLAKQFLVPSSPLTIPLWIAGLWLFLRKEPRFRALGVAFLITLALFAAAQGREYYTAPLYPMLLAGGAIVATGWPRWARVLTWVGLAVAVGMGVAFILPLAPAGSRWMQSSLRVNGDLREEIGWQDLTRRVAEIRDGLPPQERAATAILTGNFGEAGALDLYGAAYGLPRVFSRVNSYWMRDAGTPLADTVIVVGISPETLAELFQSCEDKGRISNSLGVRNEETEIHKYLFVCRDLKDPAEFWRKIRVWA